MNLLEMLSAAILVNIFDVYIVYNYFEIFFEKNERVKRSYVIVVYGSYWLISSFIQAAQSSSIVFTATTLLLLLMVSFILYRSTWSAKIFLSILLLLISVFAEIMMAILMIKISGVSVEVLQNNATAQLVGGTMSKLVMFFFIKIIGYIKKAPIVKTSLLNWIALFSVPALSLPILQYVFYNSIDIDVAKSKLSTVVIISVLYINGFLFYAFESIMRQSQEQGKLEIAERQLLLQAGHYKEMNEVNERVLGLKHDLKHYLIGIDELISEGKYEDIRSRLYEWNDRINSGSKVFNSGNPVIDSLISNKWSVAEEAGIIFEHKIQIPEDICIDPIDACIILGNGFDNAIDACKRMKGGLKKPYISINMKTVGNTLQISFANSYDETEIGNRKGFKTIKADKINHGYGLANIESTVNKYKGIMRKTSNDGEFILDIVLLLG